MADNSVNSYFIDAVNYLLDTNPELTKGELAKNLDVLPSTISGILKNKQGPTLKILERLFEIYNVSKEFIFNGTLPVINGAQQQAVHNLPMPPDVRRVQNQPSNTIPKPDIIYNLNEPKTQYSTGHMPRIVTVNQAGIDNIIFVPVRAQAGYLLGHGDQEFIENLPSFNMPGLRNATFRMFEVKGVSMAPTLSEGDKVIGEWVPNLNEIRDGRVHIVVHNKGVVIKRVLNRIKERGKLYLKSDTITYRADYPIVELDPSEVLEIWYVRLKISGDLSEPSELYNRVADLEINLLELSKRVEGNK
ncbi:MAG: family peptidase [Flavipsychrobacter sp.]|jgi:transcriptional regulator with XRE-family HTH domain/signal peptidase I|nr:family peptidase [Flavipsychrobacter sp.]